MTRLASILGVATVATLVLLSGCESAVKTDYAMDLEGTWSTELARMIPLDRAMPMDLTDVTTTVTAVITDGDGLNTGDLMLTVADTVSATMTELLETVVSGSITVSKTEIVVTISGVEPMAVVDANPAFAPLLAQPQTLTYTLSDDDSELTVASTLLPILLGPTHTELTFTK